MRPRPPPHTPAPAPPAPRPSSLTATPTTPSPPTLPPLPTPAGLASPLHAEQAPADATTFDPVEVKAARDKRASTNQNVTTL
ncbi:hypothetical protein G3N88_24005, partial [Xanthomonas hortorum pv. gardneri]